MVNCLREMTSKLLTKEGYQRQQKTKQKQQQQQQNGREVGGWEGWARLGSSNKKVIFLNRTNLAFHFVATLWSEISRVSDQNLFCIPCLRYANLVGNPSFALYLSRLGNTNGIRAPLALGMGTTQSYSTYVCIACLCGSTVRVHMCVSCMHPYIFYLYIDRSCIYLRIICIHVIH